MNIGFCFDFYENINRNNQDNIKLFCEINIINIFKYYYINTRITAFYCTFKSSKTLQLFLYNCYLFLFLIHILKFYFFSKI